MTQIAAMRTVSGVRRKNMRSAGIWLPAMTTDRIAMTSAASTMSDSDPAR